MSNPWFPISILLSLEERKTQKGEIVREREREWEKERERDSERERDIEKIGKQSFNIISNSQINESTNK